MTAYIQGAKRRYAAVRQPLGLSRETDPAAAKLSFIKARGSISQIQISAEEIAVYAAKQERSNPHSELAITRHAITIILGKSLVEDGRLVLAMQASPREVLVGMVPCNITAFPEDAGKTQPTGSSDAEKLVKQAMERPEYSYPVPGEFFNTVARFLAASMYITGLAKGSVVRATVRRVVRGALQLVGKPLTPLLRLPPAKAVAKAVPILSCVERLVYAGSITSKLIQLIHDLSPPLPQPTEAADVLVWYDTANYIGHDVLVPAHGRPVLIVTKALNASLAEHKNRQYTAILRGDTLTYTTMGGTTYHERLLDHSRTIITVTTTQTRRNGVVTVDVVYNVTHRTAPNGDLIAFYLPVTISDHEHPLVGLIKTTFYASGTNPHADPAYHRRALARYVGLVDNAKTMTVPHDAGMRTLPYTVSTPSDGAGSITAVRELGEGEAGKLYLCDEYGTWAVIPGSVVSALAGRSKADAPMMFSLTKDVLAKYKLELHPAQINVVNRYFGGQPYGSIGVNFTTGYPSGKANAGLICAPVVPQPLGMVLKSASNILDATKRRLIDPKAERKLLEGAALQSACEFAHELHKRLTSNLTAMGSTDSKGKPQFQMLEGEELRARLCVSATKTAAYNAYQANPQPYTCEINLFPKQEGIKIGKPLRQISDPGSQNKNAVAGLVYPLYDALELKSQDDGLPVIRCCSYGLNRAAVADLVLAYAARFDALTETDISNCDAYVNPVFITLTFTILRDLYPKENHERLSEFETAFYKGRIHLSDGSIVTTDGMNTSGNMLTSFISWFANCCGAFHAHRLAGESPHESFENLGPKAGDDNIDAALDTLPQGYSDMGFNIKIRTVHRLADAPYITYLSNIFPDPWNLRSCVSDFYRACAGITTFMPGSDPIGRVKAYIHSDGDTPGLRTLLPTLLARLQGNAQFVRIHAKNTGPKSEWDPQVRRIKSGACRQEGDLDATLRAIAEHTRVTHGVSGFEVSTLIELEELFANPKALEPGPINTAVLFLMGLEDKPPADTLPQGSEVCGLYSDIPSPLPPSAGPSVTEGQVAAAPELVAAAISTGAPLTTANAPLAGLVHLAPGSTTADPEPANKLRLAVANALRPIDLTKPIPDARTRNRKEASSTDAGPSKPRAAGGSQVQDTKQSASAAGPSSSTAPPRSGKHNGLPGSPSQPLGGTASVRTLGGRLNALCDQDLRQRDVPSPHQLDSPGITGSNPRDDHSEDEAGCSGGSGLQPLYQPEACQDRCRSDSPDVHGERDRLRRYSDSDIGTRVELERSHAEYCRLSSGRNQSESSGSEGPGAPVPSPCGLRDSGLEFHDDWRGPSIPQLGHRNNLGGQLSCLLGGRTHHRHPVPRGSHERQPLLVHQPAARRAPVTPGRERRHEDASGQRSPQGTSQPATHIGVPPFSHLPPPQSPRGLGEDGASRPADLRAGSPNGLAEPNPLEALSSGTPASDGSLSDPPTPPSPRAHGHATSFRYGPSRPLLRFKWSATK